MILTGRDIGGGNMKVKGMNDLNQISARMDMKMMQDVELTVGLGKIEYHNRI